MCSGDCGIFSDGSNCGSADVDIGGGLVVVVGGLGISAWTVKDK